MSGYDSRFLDRDEDTAGPGAGGAPGKRTLTQGIPSLRGQQREVTQFDSPGEYYDSRATIDAPIMTSSKLTARQLRKARRRNPHWQDKLGFSTSLFGGGAVETGEFADNVADQQPALGVPVDGIAGPRTVEAAAAAQGADQDKERAFEATRGRRDASGAARRATPGGMDGDGDYYDSRATVDPPAAFAGEDPFAVHLIGQKEG